MKGFLAAAGVAGIVLLGIAGPALGHAKLVSAEPADGSTVEGPSISVVLTYDEPLAEGSSATLSGPSGQPEFILSIDPADPTRMTSGPDPLTVEPGAYTVEWSSVGTDGDIERGTVRFTVTEAPTPTGAPPTPAPTAAPSPTATPAPGDGGSDNTSDVILPIVVGLIVVALVAWRLLRRGSTGS
jgi:methionine-rich copper-binding protein CopC